MKKVYETPSFIEESFVANEYCSTCGVTEYGKYLFECTYGDENAYDGVGDLWQETNGLAGLQTTYSQVDGKWYGPDKELGSYHPCGKDHPTDNMNDFVSGYYVPATGYGLFSYQYDYSKVSECTIWLTTYANGSRHAMANVPQDHWTVERS